MLREDDWLRRLAEVYFDEKLPVEIALDNGEARYAGEDRREAVVSQVLKLPKTEPEAAWRFIQISTELPLSTDQLELLGSGVLEGLMSAHGEDFLARVEDAAKGNSAMQLAVDAVWVASMDAYVARAFKGIQSHRGKRTS